MSFLTDILSPVKRKHIYGIYSAVGLIFGAIQAGFATLNSGTPDWLKVALAVYAFAGTAIGATAASNVSTSPPTSTPSNK
jgi:hypothetical protein